MKRTLLLSLTALVMPMMVFAAFNKDLSFGSRGSEVTMLQQFLTSEKLYSGPITGYFGLITKKSVQDFQMREKITPRSGFVGPLTRARINQLVASSTPATPSIATPPATTTASTTVPVADTTPPLFVTGPMAVVSSPVQNGPFGSVAPYQIIFNWGTNEPAALVGFACDPNVLQSGVGAAATYWSGSAGARTCAITVEDQARNRAVKDFSFIVPDLVIASGGRTIPFAESLYLGDLRIKNNSTSTITLFRVTLTTEEALNAPSSRGKSIDIFFRNGTTTDTALLSHEKETLRTTFPGEGNVNMDTVNLAAGKILVPGEEHTYGLWVESLGGPSFGGFMRVTVSSIMTIPDITIMGRPVYTIQ